MKLDFFLNAWPYSTLLQEALTRADVSSRIAGRSVLPCLALEFGTGHGETLRRICGTGYYSRIVTVDSDLYSLAFARAQVGKGSETRISFINGDIADMVDAHRGRRIYQLAFSAYTIHNLSWEKKRQVLLGAGRLLRDGGVFLNADKIEGRDRSSYRRSLCRQMRAFLVYGIRAGRLTEALRWIAHYFVDEIPDRKMRESDLLSLTRDSGFTSTEFIERFGTDCLMVAKR